MKAPKQPKDFFIQQIAELIQKNGYTRILDLGSGTSLNFIPLLEQFPDLTYVGVELNKPEAEKGRKNLAQFKNVRIYNQPGYELEKEKAGFDLCLSLSVLEHVKQLEKFLQLSIALVKSGGEIIHRYDLGHALYPCSPKEHLQVWLGNNFPKLLPENKFVCYLSEEKVKTILEKNGAKVIQTTYHQMPNLKAFLKYFFSEDAEAQKLREQILQWEYSVSPHLQSLPQATREKLFPTICIWAKKL